MESAPSASVRIGRALFRWRSVVPLPVIALILWRSLPALLWAAPPTGAERLLSALGLAACLAGQALRGYVRGVVPVDTSSPGLTLAAGSLNRAGAYRFTRNPLYLGNFLLCAGLLCQLHRLAPLALGLTFFFAEYHFIILAEEAFLRGRFGEQFERFVARVPRFWPRWTPAETESRALPFDFARALRAEHNPAMAWLTALVVLSGVRAAGSTPRSLGPIAFHLAWLAALAVVYVGVKGWKRGWWATAPS
ncbi:MAG: methyltransferase family protein [Deltaproteobacteria bacterium]